MHPSHTLRARILLAMAGGALVGAASLTGCAEDPDPVADAGAGGAPGGAGGMTTGGMTTGGMGGGMAPDASPPPDYPPLPDTLSCPPDDGQSMESGPCCEQVACYDPEAGVACPEATNDNSWSLASDLGYPSLGSGECLCDLRGPYQPPQDAAGRCCYVISIQWCTGRPFNLDGLTTTAPAARRTDWM